MANYDAQPGREGPPQLDLSAAQREASEVDLYAGLTGVARIVAGARGVMAVLDEVAEFARQANPGGDGGGVRLHGWWGDTPSIETWAVTGEFVENIDKVQYLDVH